LVIGLPLRNKQLGRVSGATDDPASPDYHHYVTPAEFTEQFAPTEQDYQSAIAFSKAHGFTITGTHANRLLLDVDASVADIEKAFM